MVYVAASFLLVNTFLLSLVGAKGDPTSWTNSKTPGDNVAPDVVKGCTYWVNNVSSKDACSSIKDYFMISQEMFTALNPSLKFDCSGMEAGQSYCVEAWQPPTADQAEWTTTISTSYSTGIRRNPTAVQTATPPTTTSSFRTQEGIAPSCKKYHLVKPLQPCADIIEIYDIDKEDFTKWNPSVREDCSNLWANFHVCVDAPAPATLARRGVYTNRQFDYVAGYNSTGSNLIARSFNSSTNSHAPRSFIPSRYNNSYSFNSTSRYVSTIKNDSSNETNESHLEGYRRHPNPGISTECSKFHRVKKGEDCSTISRIYRIPLMKFHRMNTGIGKECRNLLAGQYVCVEQNE